MFLNQFLMLAAVLFCIGVYGVIARRNAVLVLMSIELILNAVNINLVAFSAMTGDVSGQVFALFVIDVTAAEVGVGLAPLQVGVGTRLVGVALRHGALRHLRRRQLLALQHEPLCLGLLTRHLLVANRLGVFGREADVDDREASDLDVIGDP